MKKAAEEMLDNYEWLVKEVAHTTTSSKPYKEKKTQSFKAVNVHKLTKTDRAYYERKQA